MVDNREGDFKVNYFDENDQKNNLATTMRFDLIKELIKLLMLCICFLRQAKKIKIPSQLSFQHNQILKSIKDEKV